MSAHNTLFELFQDASPDDIQDPGASGTITVNRMFGRVALVSAGAESRTLPAPSRENVQLLLYMKTDGGDITLTVTGGCDEAGSTSLTFSDAGQYVLFTSVETAASTYRWRVVGGDGVTGYVADQAALKIAGTLVSATATEINRTCDVSGRLVAGGSALTVTEALHDGKVIKLDTAAGTTCTLPAASGSGAKFTFVITTVATSNSHVIKVANASDTMYGQVLVMPDDAATGPVIYFSAGGTDDTITLNRTTTGSVALGEFFEVVDVAANKWWVSGVTKATGTEATPFSATVS